MSKQKRQARALLAIILFQTIFAPMEQMRAASVFVNGNAFYAVKRVGAAQSSASISLSFLEKTAAETARPKPVKTPHRIKGGPGTPEVQSFTPAGTDNLVDLFTGDFTYNIPLVDVGGYPINLSYHSGIGPNEEASWVGLGWTLNPGAVNRDVRGLPDDCKGDFQQRQMNLRDNVTTTLSGNFGVQLFGVDLPIGFGANTAVSHNSYRGWSLTSGLGVSLEASKSSGNSKLGGSLNLTAGIDSRDGGYLDAGLGLSAEAGRAGANLGVGLKINAIDGLDNVNFELGAKYSSLQSGTSGAFPFASTAYTPKIEMPMRSKNLLFRGTIGGEVNGVHLNGSLSGAHSEQHLATKDYRLKSYGYLYAQHAGKGDQLDLNREKDGPYQKELPNLPLTAFTYDLYSVTAQGMNEQFRPFRGDIGTLHDPQMQSVGDGISAGVEVGLGNLVHVGLDFTAQNTQAVTQQWTADNALVPYFPFADTLVGTPLYEPVYFKSLAETTAMGDEAVFQLLNSGAPVKPLLQDPNLVSFGRATNKLSNRSVLNDPAQTLQHQRTPRNSQFNWMTAEDMTQRGAQWLDMGIFQKKRGSEPAEPRTNGNRKPQHISEIEVTANGGTRFQYGIPAYNNVLKQVSFNVGEHPAETTPGLVPYSPGVDNGINNTKGPNDYFNAEFTPAHAYAWLLTSVLSPDYVDLNNDGPTSDDMGTYTKFSYSLAHRNFKWRNPVAANNASLDERAASDLKDDQGHYTYGEKEIWYLAQVESRNYVAFFETSDRDDAKGVLGENGGIDANQRLKQLDKISLYTFQEYQAAAFASPARAPIPIKTVHFEYDYSLCKNAPGSAAGQGKLTLKKLWFSYLKSDKDAHSPYRFNYAENPDFQDLGTDRWGHYKPNTAGAFDNKRFPYVQQSDAATQDRNAAAWNLSGIALPTGGLLTIEYESDRYGYVQDKHAMVMCEVVGFSRSAAGPVANTLYEGADNAHYLHFKLPNGVAHNNIEQLYACLRDIRDLYFNINVMLKPGDARPEAVAGFAAMPGISPTGGEVFGFDAAGTGTAWIKLQPVFPDNRQAIAKAGFEFIRKSMPERMDDDRYEEMGMMAALDNFVQKAEGIFAGGIEKFLFNGRYCKEMRPGSFIRLEQPFGEKLGGGSRVKKITLSDQWGRMQRSGLDEGLNFEYGQEYHYLSTDPLTGRRCSSGVAAYEPMVGNDENPLVQPVRYRIEKPLSVDLNLYQMEPFGESFFPAPQVGYSRVAVYNLHHDNSIRSASGYSVSEFFTAKDYPVLCSQTPLEVLFRDVWVPVLNLYNKRVNAAAVAQGFLVEINDMHGKPKSNRAYDQAGTAISGADYQYLGSPNRLGNSVPATDGASDQISNRSLGVSWDLALDARQYINSSYDGGAGINLEVSQYGPAPVPIPVVLPNVTEGKSEYRGLTMTKVVRRNGILSQVTAFDNGASIVTRNLLWDANTGAVLLTGTDHEFGGQNYKLNIPAYWAYPAMGQAGKNAGLRLRNINVSAGGIMRIANADRLFSGGEELWLYPKTGASVAGSTVLTPGFALKAWVYRVQPGQVILLDAEGLNTPPGRYDLRVIRSGFRNMQGETAGVLLAQSNPISGDRLILNPEKILDASTQTYSDFWQSDMLFARREPARTCACDPPSFNPKMPLGALQVLVNGLVNTPAARTAPTMTKMGEISYRVRVNSGSFIEGELQLRNETPCTFSISSNSGSSIDAMFQRLAAGSSACTLDWANLQFDELESGCGAPDGFFVPCTLDRRQGIRVNAPCLNLLNCREQSAASTADVRCDGVGVINPYFNNILGNWRALSSFHYISGRNNNGHTAGSGFYDAAFQPYWNWDVAHGGLTKTAETPRWQRGDSITVFNTYGQPLELADAVNRPGSTYYGNGHTLESANAVNAHYTDIGYDGFEEYYYYARRYYNRRDVCRLGGHLMLDFDRDFADTEAQLSLASFIVNDRSHTGKHSLKCSPARAYYVRRKVWRNTPAFVRGLRSERVAAGNFIARPADLIQPFSPRPGRYLISAWVQETNPELKSTFANAAITLRLIGGTAASFTFKAAGPIIEGWQQIYGEFDINASNTDLEIALSSLGGELYFDDLRIQPFNSSMKSYVYDDLSLRLTAVLDAQNFSAFYEYDSEGQLARKKRETERGVLTVQEVRAAKAKSE